MTQGAMVTALQSTIDALRDTATATAASSVSVAEADAAIVLAQATTDAAEILAQARADGAAAAEHAATAAVTAAGREGRELILGAQRRAYDALRQGARDELARRVASSAGVALFARLEALARARLGPGATIARLDDGRIGVRATDGKRSLELTADRFVEHQLAARVDRIAALWR